ncbi:MAG: motility-associated protein, partial [Betaproteobacteria bacterium]
MRVRLDKLTIAGLLLAAAAIFGGQWVEGGSLGSLIQFAPMLIVIGGTLAAVLVQSPLATFVDAVHMGRWIFIPPNFDPPALIAEIVGWAEAARRDG